MEYKGYEVEDNFTDTNKFKGVRVHLYNNDNGMYGFFELGKEFDLWGFSGIKPEDFHKETWQLLAERAIDNYTDDSERHVQKYSLDFIQGADCAIQRYLPVK